jgi:hypothetical protein
MNEGRSLKTFDYIRQPFARVRGAILKDPRRIFSRATTLASERAERLASSLRAQVAGIELGKQIHIEVMGSADTRYDDAGLPTETRIELQWTALGRAALFPTMKAELVVRSLSAVETQLEFVGSYQPPLGAVGAVIDAVVGHRVAESCVQQFVVDVARQVANDLAN